MALTANQIAQAAAPFNGFDDRAIRVATLYLLKQIAGNTMSANQLANAAAKACLNCSDERSIWVQILYTLNQIQAGGGTGGGSGSVLQGTIDPVAAPANPAVPALYTNLTTGVIWTWIVTSQTWV